MKCSPQLQGQVLHSCHHAAPGPRPQEEQQLVMLSHHLSLQVSINQQRYNNCRMGSKIYCLLQEVLIISRCWPAGAMEQQPTEKTSGSAGQQQQQQEQAGEGGDTGSGTVFSGINNDALTGR